MLLEGMFTSLPPFFQRFLGLWVKGWGYELGRAFLSNEKKNGHFTILVISREPLFAKSRNIRLTVVTKTATK